MGFLSNRSLNTWISNLGWFLLRAIQDIGLLKSRVNYLESIVSNKDAYDYPIKCIQTVSTNDTHLMDMSGITYRIKATNINSPSINVFIHELLRSESTFFYVENLNNVAMNLNYYKVKPIEWPPFIENVLTTLVVPIGISYIKYDISTKSFLRIS